MCKNQYALTFIGDVILGKQISRAIEKNSTLISNLISPAILKIFQNSENVCANFEGSFYTDSLTPFQKWRGMPAEFTLGYKNPDAIVDFLKTMRCGVLSLANNHSVDFGLEGMRYTKHILEKSGLLCSGTGINITEALTPQIMQYDNFSVSIVSFTDLAHKRFYAKENSAGVAQMNEDNIKNAIVKARKNSDFVIIFLHTIKNILDSFSSMPDAHQKKFYRFSIDSGADMVIGHHPHGLQKIEKYKGKLICYSLGAFLYDPELSNIFPRNHYLYPCTQIHGGGILAVKLCAHGIYNFRITPTKTIRTKEGDFVVKIV